MRPSNLRDLEAEASALLQNYCEDCLRFYGQTHRCSNPKPSDLAGMPYYQKRREYLLMKQADRWGDNDPASPEQAGWDGIND